MDLGDLREEYTRDGLRRSQLPNNPLSLFEQWFLQAQQAKLLEPNAMSLSTVAVCGQPSSRTVLLKYFDDNGFVFFTNYHSRKAQQIADNNQVALLFPWVALERQVSVQGYAEKISNAESLKYFLSRPKGSQLGAWVSQQSTVIDSRQVLEIKMAEVKRKFKNGVIPLPDFWGGYRVVPTCIEFWQGRSNRLHDRFCYYQQNGQWQIDRLSP